MESAEYDRLRVDLRAIVDKIDKLMSREEYERRHAAMEDRVNKLEADMRTMATWGGKEHADMRKEVSDRFDKILEKFDEFKGEVQEARITSGRWVLGLVLSFMGGGGLVGVLAALHLIH